MPEIASTLWWVRGYWSCRADPSGGGTDDATQTSSPIAMLSFAGSLKVFVALDACDMRAGPNPLQRLVGERLQEQVRDGALFVIGNNGAQ